MQQKLCQKNRKPKLFNLGSVLTLHKSNDFPKPPFSQLQNKEYIQLEISFSTQNFSKLLGPYIHTSHTAFRSK